MRNIQKMIGLFVIFILGMGLLIYTVPVAYNAQEKKETTYHITDGETTPEETPKRPGNEPSDNEPMGILHTRERPSNRPSPTKRGGLLPPKEESDNVDPPGSGISDGGYNDKGGWWRDPDGKKHNWGIIPEMPGSGDW